MVQLTNLYASHKNDFRFEVTEIIFLKINFYVSNNSRLSSSDKFAEVCPLWNMQNEQLFLAFTNERTVLTKQFYLAMERRALSSTLWESPSVLEGVLLVTMRCFQKYASSLLGPSVDP